MKRYINSKWFSGALMTVALSTGMASCSDEHFDITSEANGKLTIWESIKQNDDLSNFADILQSVYYSQTEEKTTDETYADLLNGDQTFTVWAPKNNSFDYAYYKGLLQSGVRENIYKVENELIRNYMTRYSITPTGTGKLNVTLFNSKTAEFSHDDCTIKGVSMGTNIGSKNGVLYVIDKPLEYLPNLYEYLATRADLDSINTFIKGFQTREFNENASTPGPTVDGIATWVDSVTYLSNNYTNVYMRALLNREDSNYVMIIPDNKAWDNTLSKTKKYFKMKESYYQNTYSVSKQGKDETTTTDKKFTTVEIDSLMNLLSKNAICENLVYNGNWQYEKTPISTLKEISEADSLKTTTGLKIKHTGTLNATNNNYVLEIDDYASLFGNKDPEVLSNGYAYVVDEFTYPYKIYAPDLKYESRMAFESADADCSASFTSKTYNNPTIYIDGEPVRSDSLYKYTYCTMKSNDNAHPGAYFALNNVLSCKYDIYAVIGYNTDYMLPNKFRVYMCVDEDGKRVTKKSLKNPDPEAVDVKGQSLYDGNYYVNKPLRKNEDGSIAFTDTICIAKDYEFPYSYYGVNGFYPLLQIKSYFSSTEKSSYTRDIWVSAIILKSKEWKDEEKTEE